MFVCVFRCTEWSYLVWKNMDINEWPCLSIPIVSMLIQNIEKSSWTLIRYSISCPTTDFFYYNIYYKNAGFTGLNLQIAKSKMVLELIPMSSLNSNQETLLISFNHSKSSQSVEFLFFSGSKLAELPWQLNGSCCHSGQKPLRVWGWW